MKVDKNIFLKKKILIYGLGKSGISSFKFLNNKSNVYLYDDFIKNINNSRLHKRFINLNEISSYQFEKIIISPGIDIKNCKLSKFLKKNFSKIYTDLDVFYSFYKNKSITITGTNGKSTTAKILHDVLLDQKYDVRLIGNIGNPALSEKQISKKTIFVIEASSYQLEYSKVFTSKYSLLLNISPDHIERHGNLKNYINAKFKLLKSQTNQSVALINKNDPLITKQIKRIKLNPKIIKVETLRNDSLLSRLNNKYFLSFGNRENLFFILMISKILRLKYENLIKTLNNFKGLKYRQQIIFENKNLIIINDSKSTSFASSENLLRGLKNVYWILGGIPKKGDKFKLSKNHCKKFKAYTFGNHHKDFKKCLSNKIILNNLNTLHDILHKIFVDIRKKKLIKNIILFSPAGASFDNFKNFEDRGQYFNNLIKKFINAN